MYAHAWRTHTHIDSYRKAEKIDRQTLYVTYANVPNLTYKNIHKQ